MEADSKVSLKLLVNTTNQTVLFAEAGKDFVDFLFYILSLPVGAVVKVLEKDNMGSLRELYHGFEALSETYIQPNKTKSSVLNPEPPIRPKISLLPFSNDESKSRQFFSFGSASGPPGFASWATDVSEGGFVKGTVNYMVMDNLHVEPITSVICWITLFNKFKVKGLSSLEERVVDFGVDEGLKLLKASMDCKNVLTSIFLGNNN
ncbi:DUF674 family protein [Melia azedarach]|uniref:DUF674 family protein n=1 Tax=Melia azedarach TaxID=155640 RepID=A0ACC1YJQ6_MELAZ|nr:DUF674 family protein [Melia azedarach]